MPILSDVLAGQLAQAVQVQQIIDALKGAVNKGVPIALISLNDANNYALSVQNDDPTNSRALSVLKADGSTLISADSTGLTLGSPLNLAAGSLPPSAIPTGSITSAMILDGTIQNVDIAAGTITSANIGAQQVQAANIAPQAVGQGQLGDLAVITQKIADSAVTSVKIGAQQVQAANIGPAAVNYPALAVGAATQAVSAVGSTANPTTTSTTLVDLPDMVLSISTIGGDVLISLCAVFSCTTLNAIVQMQLNLDGADVANAIAQASMGVANQTVTLSIRWRIAAPATAGHTIKGRWSTSAGTATATWQYRALVAEELRR
jgi:hypothetical protein